jgi:hypothetical protein
MSRGHAPPSLRCLVRAQRGAGTLLQQNPALTLTNPITTTLTVHYTQYDSTLLSSLRDKATHITDPHTYKQAYCDFSPRHTHVSLLSLWKNSITTWPTPLPRLLLLCTH